MNALGGTYVKNEMGHLSKVEEAALRTMGIKANNMLSNMSPCLAFDVDNFIQLVRRLVPSQRGGAPGEGEGEEEEEEDKNNKEEEEVEDAEEGDIDYRGELPRAVDRGIRIVGSARFTDVMSIGMLMIAIGLAYVAFLQAQAIEQEILDTGLIETDSLVGTLSETAADIIRQHNENIKNMSTTERTFAQYIYQMFAQVQTSVTQVTVRNTLLLVQRAMLQVGSRITADAMQSSVDACIAPTRTPPASGFVNSLIRGAQSVISFMATDPERSSECAMRMSNAALQRQLMMQAQTVEYMITRVSTMSRSVRYALNLSASLATMSLTYIGARVSGIGGADRPAIQDTVNRALLTAPIADPQVHLSGSASLAKARAAAIR